MIKKKGIFCFFNKILIHNLTPFQWKKKTEKQRVAIKFKAAARIARVTHDLSAIIRNANIAETIQELDENVE